MRSFALKVIVCPKCGGEFDLEKDEVRGDEVVEGTLTCRQCSESYPIHKSIGRFVPMDNYSSSFGFQWNFFRKDQIDKFSGTTLSRDRFLKETEWDSKSVAGKLLIDIG